MNYVQEIETAIAALGALGATLPVALVAIGIVVWALIFYGIAVRR